jgi:hypothetical protein
MLEDGKGCEKDLRQAVIWDAKVGRGVFWELLEDANRALDCDFNQLFFSLGGGLYWYQYGSVNWNEQDDDEQVFGNRCRDYYCSCVELQQKSIFTFLLFWNRTTGGIKGPGQMITKLVWEEREDNLVKIFE